MLSVDLDGPFLCCQRAAARMVVQGRGGRIINITSVHEHVPRVGAAPYCAARAGLGLLTGTLSIELAQHGITVNTPVTGEENLDPRLLSRPGVPLGRPGDAERWPPSSPSWQAPAPPM